MNRVDHVGRHPGVRCDGGDLLVAEALAAFGRLVTVQGGVEVPDAVGCGVGDGRDGIRAAGRVLSAARLLVEERDGAQLDPGHAVGEQPVELTGVGRLESATGRAHVVEVDLDRHRRVGRSHRDGAGGREVLRYDDLAGHVGQRAVPSGGLHDGDGDGRDQTDDDQRTDPGEDAPPVWPAERPPRAGPDGAPASGAVPACSCVLLANFLVSLGVSGHADRRAGTAAHEPVEPPRRPAPSRLALYERTARLRAPRASFGNEGPRSRDD